MSAPATQAIYPNHPGHPHSQVLDGLIHLGADLARLLHQKAVAQAAQPQSAPAQPNTALLPAPDALISIAAAFDRIARAVRRCIMLARSLAEPLPPARDPAQHRAAARKRILREVEDSIQRTSRNRDAASTLRAELHDRLDAPDLDDDLGSRPIADIITEICRDLGLASLAGDERWKRRTPRDLAELNARAAAASRQPGAQPPESGPDPGPAAGQRPATPPAQAGAGRPADPAAAIATIPSHPTRLRGHWRPPPGE